MTDFEPILESLKTNTHTIHCITSPLAANDTANVLLSLNQAPIMAEYKEEVADITKNADALLINLGTINEYKLAGISEALKSAKKNKVPIVLDPVGSSASKIRLKTSLYYLENFGIRVLKGNYSEIYSIYHKILSTKGVDSKKLDRNLMIEIAQKLATTYNIFVIASGKEDIVTDGRATIVLENGHPILPKITGTGCMLGGIIAGCISHEISMASILTAISTINIAAELAEKDKGMGTFRVSLLDEISLIDDHKIKERIKYEKL